MDVLARDGYVEEDSLAFSTTSSNSGRVLEVRLEGRLRCANDVQLDVTKVMDARQGASGPEVITTYYRYHAHRGQDGTPVVRYDQAHGGPHCHRYARDGSESAYFILTLDEMPRLDEVVREAVEIARRWDAEG
jgi:hypothetical protein